MLKIIILEDNAERRLAMAACVRDRFHQYEAIFFDRPDNMLAFLESNLSSALAISLDHDMELLPEADGKLADSGTGRQIAEFLASQVPCCPVIIHTSNAAAGDAMEFLLREARWQTHRVHPWGDMDWISGPWFRALRDAIVASARPRTHARS